MAHIRARLSRGFLAALLVLTATAVPTYADSSTRFHAVYDETTTPRTCPDGVPKGAFCYTGVGHGPTFPPGGQGTENFAGYVDSAQASATMPCPPDFNVVSITTSRGTLFLTTSGNACQTSPTTSVDQGTWRAVGGTGIFKDASGSGTVATEGTFNVDGTISSRSVYSGRLTLH